MRCKNCGWENPEEQTRCEKCDSPLEGAAQYQPVAGVEARKTMAGCPKCGYPLRASDQRCPNCDQPVEANEAHFQPTLNGTVMAGMGTGERQKEGKRLEAFLVTYSPNPLGDFFPVFEGRNYVGRDHLSNICVEGDSLISGKHFSILYRPVDKKFKFRDEQSSNGTFVNDQLADEGELQHGDVIRIGSTRLLFMIIPTF